MPRQAPYSKGGPAIIDNAQLTHRYCNRRKSDKPT
ncbi:MAG: HNH endonuclease [Treponema sp.]|nr:HNH endonuclease [Treponema sp.]